MLKFDLNRLYSCDLLGTYQCTFQMKCSCHQITKHTYVETKFELCNVFVPQKTRFMKLFKYIGSNILKPFDLSIALFKIKLCCFSKSIFTKHCFVISYNTFFCLIWGFFLNFSQINYISILMKNLINGKWDNNRSF